MEIYTREESLLFCTTPVLAVLHTKSTTRWPQVLAASRVVLKLWHSVLSASNSRCHRPKTHSLIAMAPPFSVRPPHDTLSQVFTGGSVDLFAADRSTRDALACAESVPATAKVSASCETDDGRPRLPGAPRSLDSGILQQTIARLQLQSHVNQVRCEGERAAQARSTRALGACWKEGLSPEPLGTRLDCSHNFGIDGAYRFWRRLLQTHLNPSSGVRSWPLACCRWLSLTRF